MAYLGNDYSPLEKRVQQYEQNGTFNSNAWQPKVSVVVNVYNQEEQLKKQLAALAKQTYNLNNIEVIISDDGGKRGSGSCMDLVANMDLPFDVKYIWQPKPTNPKAGKFQLGKARNEAMKRAQHDTLIFLDADMIPEHTYVEEVMKWHYIGKEMGVHVITNQDRAFVELDENKDFDKLVNEQRLNRVKRARSRRFPENQGTNDWHKKHYDRTDRLKRLEDLDDPPYRIGSFISGGNCAFSRADANEAGLYDETFNQYGGEDSEFGVRMMRHFNERLGRRMFFIPVEATAYHLEHGGPIDPKQKQAMREIFERKAEQAKAREVDPLPEVSIYMPCYNQDRFIRAAIESVAKQDYGASKLEVVVGNDGSTDDSRKFLEQLKKEYKGRLKIQLIDDGKNHGLADNTNRIAQACRGKYLLQLDGDDELLPNAVSTLVAAFQKHPDASIVFGDCKDREVKFGKDGKLLPKNQWGEMKDHWSCNEFTEEWYARNPQVSMEQIADLLYTSMRIHPPRMFLRETLYKTEGVNPNLQSATDYDLMTKLVAHGRPIHVKQRLYIYNQNHGANTSNKGRLQDANGKVVQNEMYARLKEEKVKRVYIVDESEKRSRDRAFDLLNPTRRVDAMYDVWQIQENRSNISSLYNAIVSELEGLVAFFRWTQPEVARSQLERLQEIQEKNTVGLYYQATFLQGEGRSQEALNTLRKIKNMGSSARSLEQVILSTIAKTG